MANEIYDSTWWGNTIDTASSIGTSTEMIQGQFNLTKLGDELVVNGDFATDSDWVLGSGTTISGGNLDINFIGAGNTAFQSLTLSSGSTQKVTVNCSSYTSGEIDLRVGSTSNAGTISGVGTYTFYIQESGYAYINFFTISGFIGSIDNVSVKEVRATTVEASKCLADAIHRIGIQDIQN